MAKRRKLPYDLALSRPKRKNTFNYLVRGRASIFGIGNDDAKHRIDEIYRIERPQFSEALARWNVELSEVELIEPIAVDVIGGITHVDKKDGYIRGSKYYVDYIAFSEDKIYVYSKEWHTLDYAYNVTTYEFSYEDICSVGIVEENVHEVTEKRRLVKSNRIRNKEARYVRLEFQFNGWRYSTSLFSTEVVPIEKLQAAIRLIRQKKE